MARILVVNAGSSSLKLAVVEDGVRGAAITIERWQGGDLDAMDAFVTEAGVLDGVGHRVVHGGPQHTAPARVDEELLASLAAIEDLAPLHNPRAIAAIEDVHRLRPDLPAAASFDTAFHAGLPLAAATYALPRTWNRRMGLRRYGFHGLSHAHIARRSTEMVGKGAGLRVISCHLGAGASLAAIVGGRSVDTTMGFTALEGLVMASRSGTVDPGLLLWLLTQRHMDPGEVEDALYHRSGLAGLTGTSGDLRDVRKGKDDGDPDCVLAYDVFVHRLRREIGAMAASAGGVDVLAFTGGIGENAADVRRDTVDGLAHLDLAVDLDANGTAAPDADITAGGSAATVLVLAASEDLEIAREATEVLDL